MGLCVMAQPPLVENLERRSCLREHGRGGGEEFIALGVLFIMSLCIVKMVNGRCNEREDCLTYGDYDDEAKRDKRAEGKG